MPTPPPWLGELDDAWRQRLFGLEAWQAAGLALGLFAAGLLAWAIHAALVRLFRLTRWVESGHVRIDTLRGAGRAFRLLLFAWIAADVVLTFASGNWLDNLQTSLVVLRYIAGTWMVIAVWELACDLYGGTIESRDPRLGRLMVPLVRKFGRAALAVFGGIAAAATLGINVAGIVAGLGIGGIALALAAKDSVENVFGSLTIVLDMPFAVGDWVKIGTVDGVVEEINLRSTRIRTVQDSVVTLPNSNLIKASVENMGLRRSRRVQTQIPLSPTARAAQIRALLDDIRAVIAAKPTVRAESAQAFLGEVSPTGATVQLTVYFDVPTYSDEVREREALLLEVLELAERHEIAVAPTATRS
jgi:MscS family membrane protein